MEERGQKEGEAGKEVGKENNTKRREGPGAFRRTQAALLTLPKTLDGQQLEIAMRHWSPLCNRTIFQLDPGITCFLQL